MSTTRRPSLSATHAHLHLWLSIAHAHTPTPAVLGALLLEAALAIEAVWGAAGADAFLDGVGVALAEAQQAARDAETPGRRRARPERTH
jgi:hypothetical protein